MDNDEVRYTADVLRDWKAQAEAAAARELEHRLHRFPDRSAVFERIERLMPALIARCVRISRPTPFGVSLL